MPELVNGGPDVPADLMNALDDGCAVFFCGAGISIGSGLPSFEGLVREAYQSLHQEPNEIEQDLVDRGDFDKALGLLEGRVSDREALRRFVTRRLSEPAPGDLPLHKGLLNLSRSPRGRARLVTTNFDNRFVEAGCSQTCLDVSPRLPVPKRHDWDTVVHLHGRISELDGGGSLILTGADFGRAYLSEGWAARFVTELFREFTVIFVGYSLNDPVMGYLVDALAAERVRGAGGFRQPFAFADTLPDGRGRVVDLWRSKGVEPIVYDRVDSHRLLTETIVEWARVRNDPLGSRTSIVLEGIRKPPVGPHDELTKRVTWALSYPGVARGLAEAQPVTEETDFDTLAAWLDVLYEAGLLGHVDSPTVAPIVDAGSRSASPPFWDTGTRYLAWWISRHIHVPHVVEWALRRGGVLHPQMRDMVRDRLWRNDPTETTIGPQLRLYWQMLSSPPRHVPVAYNLPSLLAKAETDGERAIVEKEALEALAPILVLRPGPSAEANFRHFAKADAPSLTPLERCGHLEMRLAGEAATSLIEDLVDVLKVNKQFLRKYAAYVTVLIGCALDLRVIAGSSAWGSYGDRPSISDHDQNKHRDHWTNLITLARESYMALVEGQRASANNLLRTWLVDGRAIFRRLALHAATVDPECDVAVGEEILLTGDKPGLWDFELTREVAVFLRTAAARLSPSGLQSLVGLILEGPPVEQTDVEDDENAALRREVSIWKKLEKLSRSGANLPREALDALTGIADRLDLTPSEDDRDEFLVWVGEARWVAPGEHVPDKLKESSPGEIADAFEQSEIPAEQWRDFAQVNTKRAFLTLAILGRRHIWPGLHWQRALWAVRTTESPRDARIDNLIAGQLRHAPPEVFEKAGLAIAGWLEATATRWPADLFTLLWFKTWSACPAEGGAVDTGDIMTRAINHVAGELAEAALRRLWHRDPARESGLTDEEKTLFDAIIDGVGGGRELARVILARVLWNLHAVDRSWVNDRLLPFFRWDSSPEAIQMWQAFAWNARVGPNLLADAKDVLLETFSRSGELGEQSEHIIQTFASITVHAPGALAPAEIVAVVRQQDEDGSVALLNWFTRLLAGTADERAAVWRETIEPWIAAYWPTGADRRTRATARGFAALVIETGSAFTEALQTVAPFLQPIDDLGRIIWNLDDDEETAYQHDPAGVLELLNLITGEVEPWTKGMLRTALDNIAARLPSAQLDARWHRLMRIAQG